MPDPSGFRVRSADRTEAAIACVVGRPEQPDVPGEVRNLSPGGALLVTSPVLPIDAFLTLRFEGAEPVSAQVKWTDGEQCGCRFVRTLTVRQYLRLRQGPSFSEPVAEQTSLFAKLRGLLPGKR
jgi:hypothetical protein